MNMNCPHFEADISLGETDDLAKSETALESEPIGCLVTVVFDDLKKSSDLGFLVPPLIFSIRNLHGSQPVGAGIQKTPFYRLPKDSLEKAHAVVDRLAAQFPA